MSGSDFNNVRRRRVFYIPGYDPIHPRRYRELYRKEGAEQAAISGYALTLSPGKGDTGRYGWHVQAAIDGTSVETDVEVLVWSDIVRGSMAQGIWATYGQLLRTVWVYMASGALFGLMRLRKGPVIAALYPILMLLGQLALALLAAATPDCPQGPRQRQTSNRHLPGAAPVRRFQGGALRGNQGAGG